MKNKICLISLGCVRNLVDSEVIIGILAQNGYVIENDIASSDFIIINTCAFLKEARDEAVFTIDEVFKNKKKNAKVIITGCMADLFKKDLKNRFKDIHLFLPAFKIDHILEALLEKTHEDKALEKNIDIAKDLISKNNNSKKSFLETPTTPREITTPPSYAYLKIAEGCKKFCSYCLIPTIKGSLQSKPIDQVKQEFINLLDKGIKEIILIAQDLGDYGKDLKIENGLEKLLKELLLIKRDFFIRLLYVYPDSITDELIEIIKSDNRILKYIDIPIQHINDEILKKMRRTTSKKQIEEIIDKLKKIDDMTIRTTLMVGFPSETNKQFEELEKFLEDKKLDRVGIFKYSREKFTKSYDLKDQIDEKTKEKRRKKLYDLQEKIIEEKNRCLIGKKIPVFVEGYHADSDLLMIGRAFSQAPDVDPIIIINDHEKVDEFYVLYEAEITDVIEHDLIGKIVEKI